MHLEAWRVHDTGLVAVPGPFRRLPGGLRHHRGQGDPWPARVVLRLEGDDLVVEDVGRWPRAEVSVEVRSAGPPVSFVVRVPSGAHLLAAAADANTADFLAAVGARR